MKRLSIECIILAFLIAFIAAAVHLKISHYTVEVDLVKKRIEEKGGFSEGFLKVFPDIYKHLSKPDPDSKHYSFVEIRLWLNLDYYKDKITTKDMALLISEILLEDTVDINYYVKDSILSICEGKDGQYGKTRLSSLGKPIPEAIPYITKLLDDAYPEIRFHAARVLINLGVREKPIEKLLELVNDDDANMRWDAALALVEIGAGEGIPEVLKLLRNRVGWNISDGWNWTRAFNIETIGKLGVTEAIPEIRKLLNDPHRYIRIGAIKSLCLLGVKEAIPEIKKLLDDEDEYVREAAKEALEKLEEEKKSE